MQLSVRQAIHTAAQRGRRAEPMKAITIRLPESLDEQLERYCFETKQQKQEVIKDALMLLFEEVAAAGVGEA